MTKPPEFYDSVIANPSNPYRLPVRFSVYLPLYQQVVKMTGRQERIVDLGCGSGQFAALLRARGVGDYVGIDFSRGMIAEARKLNPRADFRLDDLRTCEIPDGDCYIALEVLEHLDEDLELLDRLPAGARLIGSVPSFDSPSHARFFDDESEVAARYGTRVALERIQRIPVRPGEGHCWFLFQGALT